MTKQTLYDRVQQARRAAREIVEDLPTMRGPRPVAAVLHSDGAWDFRSAPYLDDSRPAGIMNVMISDRCASEDEIARTLLASLRMTDAVARLVLEAFNASGAEPTLSAFSNGGVDDGAQLACGPCGLPHGPAVTFYDASGARWCSGLVLMSFAAPVPA